MRQAERERGLAELRAARRQNRGLFWSVALFSTFVNLLMLTGPLFMLQVYDRVLGSRSEETLVALFALVAFLFAMMGLLDFARGRILARIGARFQQTLDRRVFSAVLRSGSHPGAAKPAASGLQDLESVSALYASPAFASIYDIVWTPLFLAGIYIFHPLLGYLALAGGGFLIGLALLNQILTRRSVLMANVSGRKSATLGDQLHAEAELVQGLGMQQAAFDRWHVERLKALRARLRSSDGGGAFLVLTRSFRLFLQSAMLALGAWLVLRGELTAGAMIAGSILLGRALAPIELAIGQWALFQRASRGWNSLAELLGSIPPGASRTALPVPKALLQAEGVTVVPPGQTQAALRMVSFTLEPGEAMGVIGPSGAGKTTLARALTGVWRPAGGKIRLDGATLDQYDPSTLGRHVGYLPQRVQLFDGTIAENIARLATNPDDAAIVAAAQKAAAHEMILKLPDGYDTRVTSAGGQLSGGQLQRIGLARALYGDPVILVLDEPNSNLDNVGSVALNGAIRQMKADGKSVLIMAHRPAAIQECDTLLVLDGGARKAFGPRDKVLREAVKNHEDIRRKVGPGGVS